MNPEVNFNEGDLVRAVKRDKMIIGRAWRGAYGVYLSLNQDDGAESGEDGYNQTALERRGWSVTVIEKAKPKIVLPTNPLAIVKVSGHIPLVKNAYGKEEWTFPNAAGRDFVKTTSWVLEQAEAQPDRYKVIFEGVGR